MASGWRWLLFDMRTRQAVAELPVIDGSVTFSEVLNGPGAARFAIPLVPPVTTTSSTTTALAPWRGVGFSTADYDDLAKIGISWWYDWDHLGGANDPPNAGLYVPMVYGDPAVTGQGGGSIATIGQDADILLGFNEPDNAGTGGTNITYTRALALWPELIATGARLGSPAVSADPATSTTWLTNFMAGCTTNGYRVDFICAHWYGSSVSTLLAFLANLYDTYGLPIWLTEFDYVNGSVAQNAAFVTDALAALRDVTYLERVAWFSNRDYTLVAGYEHTGLVDSGGALVATGTNYAAVGNAITWTGTTSTLATWSQAAVAGWAKIEGLTDAFSAATLDERTFAYGAHADIYDGRLRIEARADFAGYAASTTMWDLTSSSASFNVGTLSTTSTDMLLVDFRKDRDQNNRIELGQTGTTLWMKGVNSGSDVGYTSTTFNATNHAWWRARDNGTNVYLDTSADGETWNLATLTLARSALTWTPNGVEVLFLVGFTGSETTPRYLSIDSFNSRSTVSPGSGSPILDETGSPILDETGEPILDETSGTTTTTTEASSTSTSSTSSASTVGSGLTAALFEMPDAGFAVESGGVLRWAGPIVTAPNYDLANGTVEFGCEGVWNYVRRRVIRTNHDFVAATAYSVAGWVPAADNLVGWRDPNIARHLLDETQAVTGGDLGIVTGSAVSTGSITELHLLAYERRNVGEVIEQNAATEGGYDWRLQPEWSDGPNSTIQWRWIPTFPATGRRTDIRWEAGGNAEVFGVQVDSTNIAYQVHVTGQGTGEAMPVVTSSSPGLISAHLLLEATESASNVTENATLIRHAHQRLLRGKAPVVTPKLDVLVEDLGSFVVGDQVKVIIDRGLLQINDRYRITAFEVDPTAGRIHVTLAPLTLFV